MALGFSHLHDTSPTGLTSFNAIDISESRHHQTDGHIDLDIQNFKRKLREHIPPVTDDPVISGYDCSDIWLRNQSSVSGVYRIKPIGAANSFETFCEMKEDGGLTVIQSHNGNDQLPFDTDWDDYKEGFGTLTGEHWLGLEKMYLLTHQCSRAADLLITLGDFDKSEASALYSPFTIGSEDMQYRISLGNYSGNAGDAFRARLNVKDVKSNQDGSSFSTWDRDNDNCNPCIMGDIIFRSCARDYSSGWWFNGCGLANLNGRWRPAKNSIGWLSSVSWETYRSNKSLKFSAWYRYINDIISLWQDDETSFHNWPVTDDPVYSGYDCSDIWLRNQSSVSGVYRIKPIGAKNLFEAFCKMKEDGGLTLIQSHNGNDQLPFNTYWDDYKEGFGTLTGEHWLGLEKMYLLTHQGSRAADLLISLGDFDKSEAFALYSPFTIGSEDVQYRISLGNYSGNAGDAFRARLDVNDVRSNQDGSSFSTRDRDNDNCNPCVMDDIAIRSCARDYSSGWWFNGCGLANLNGRWRPAQNSIGWHSSVSWETWRENESLMFSKMYMKMPSFNLFEYFILFGLYFNCFRDVNGYSEVKPVTDDLIYSGYDCSDIWVRNQRSVSGVYRIRPIGATDYFEAFCEMKKDGGLTLIQSHNGNDELSFDTDWIDYKEGFGTLTGEHWLGLENMYLLTHQGSRAADLLISLGDFDKSKAFALYSPFTIGSEDMQYRISLGNYSGNAGDAFRQRFNEDDETSNQDGSSFSTWDRDNDNCNPCFMGDIAFNSCPRVYGSGWWFNGCGLANLNGDWHPAWSSIARLSSVSWETYRSNKSLKFSKMYIKNY
ncbi:Hypothetical predicted protein [Pelobates cultripes]|uniref:Fibrinogen C-terminal domain-containing protein n=1 Tax=Pelobates cultripes TaxID=61616 RepID=A0AAD1RU54_PELCU|nr:Hypothetical predicted protein [Pelobates cultripes]